MTKTVLMTSQPARGHWNPLLRIARELKSRGYNVVLAGPEIPDIRHYLKEQAVPFRGIRPALSAMGLLIVPLLRGFAETYFAAKFFFAGIDYYARALLPLIDEIQPDIVVSEFAFPGGSFAAEVKKVPHIVLYHAGLSFPGPGIPPFASGLPINEDWAGQETRYAKLVSKMVEKVDSLISKARSRLGLEPTARGFLRYPISPWLTLVLTSQTIEAPRDPLPQTMFYIGPCFSRPDDRGSSDFPFECLSSEKPKVYVSLGTVFNKKPRIYRKIIDAFSDDKYQLIVSAGGAFKQLKRQTFSADVLLFEQVPQIAILPLVDVVISHGGNNTINETLAAGKPLLVLPVGGEQGDNASKVVYLSAGLRASINNVTEKEIREKVERLINEPVFALRTREIAAGLAKTDGIITACRFIERLIEKPGPIIRPSGYPESVTVDMPMPWE